MPYPLSRRHFLATAGTGAASVWIPRPVRGYTGAELRQWAVDDRLEVWISKWDLDTPCLCVDLDRLERNLNQMQTTVTRNGIGSRPHAKTHKCPAIARLQIEAGSVGICTAKISEAEVMFEHGIEQILMTTANVTTPRIRRAMALKNSCGGFIQAVDTAGNARDLSDAAREAGVMANIVVDVEPGGHRLSSLQNWSTRCRRFSCAEYYVTRETPSMSPASPSGAIAPSRSSRQPQKQPGRWPRPASTPASSAGGAQAPTISTTRRLD